jgi:Ulp1 family protease
MGSKSLDYFDIDLEREDMDILKRGGWFTDTIMTAYFKYVVP